MEVWYNIKFLIVIRNWKFSKEKLALFFRLSMLQIDPAHEKGNKYKTVTAWTHVYLYIHLAVSFFAYDLVLQYKNVRSCLVLS